jgi:hypothetical protein
VGWHVEPGHVGPFATLGPIVYLLVIAAWGAGLFRRVRWLAIAAALSPLAVYAIGLMTHLRRPPLQWLLLLTLVSGLALLGRPAERAMARIGNAAFVIAGAAGWAFWWLTNFRLGWADAPSAAASGWSNVGPADPAITFYRYFLPSSSGPVVASLVLAGAAGLLLLVAGVGAMVRRPKTAAAIGWLSPVSLSWGLVLIVGDPTSVLAPLRWLVRPVGAVTEILGLWASYPGEVKSPLVQLKSLATAQMPHLFLVLWPVLALAVAWYRWSRGRVAPEGNQAATRSAA